MLCHQPSHQDQPGTATAAGTTPESGPVDAEAMIGLTARGRELLAELQAQDLAGE